MTAPRVPSPARPITHQRLFSGVMRTTLHIEDDRLFAVKELARQHHSTARGVVSMLLRDALAPKTTDAAILAPEFRNGVPLLPRRPRGAKVTVELVNLLRDEDE